MPPPDLWETPERAIAAFEKSTGLRVTVHDIGTPLWPYLPPERFTHRSPCCLAVKASRNWACIDFEVTRLRREILDVPDGRYHVCHAGFMEWVVPVFLGDVLAWIFFAGQARPAGIHRHLVRDSRSTRPRPEALSRLRARSEPQAETILENLRQLRSRLVEWHHALASTCKSGASGNIANRQVAIQAFLHRHQAAPPPVRDLARHLHLSESRTIHLVRELFGCSYVRLVNQLRLRTAASLLRGSSLSVLEVCLSSGFRDLSHFHRIFLRHFDTTPLQYRKSSHA